MEPAEILAVYGRCARHVMLRYLERQSCITATRITIEVMRYFQLPAKAMPMRLIAECPELKYAYVSGPAGQLKKQAIEHGSTWIDRGTGGYQGHVVALVANAWIVDASFDQIQSIDHGLAIPATVLVMPIPSGVKRRRMYVELEAVTDNGHKLRVRYLPHHDKTFYATPAWELDIGVGFVVSAVISAMRRDSPGLPGRYRSIGSRTI